MKFSKMHGLGNDYVFVSTFDQVVAQPESLARRMAHRHHGIGSDGLILVGPSTLADVSMRMYNADGSRGRMCGNGIRCVAKLAYEQGHCPRADIRIETDSGVRQATCLISESRVRSVRVNMGAARFDTASLLAKSSLAELIEFKLPVPAREFQATCVSVGNPHAVIFLSDWNQIDLYHDGPLVEQHPMFPGRINAQFAVVTEADTIAVRTWERGSGPTQACGTGACAVAAAAARTGRAGFPIRIQLPGGALLIEASGGQGCPSTADLLMTGPATHVFDGVWLNE